MRIVNVTLGMSRQGVARPRHHRDNFQVRLFQSILDFGELLLKGVVESVVLLVEEVADAVRELLHFALVWRSTVGLKLGLNQEQAIARTVKKNSVNPVVIEIVNYRCRSDGIIHVGKFGNGKRRERAGQFVLLHLWVIPARTIQIWKKCKETRFEDFGELDNLWIRLGHLRLLPDSLLQLEHRVEPRGEALPCRNRIARSCRTACSSETLRNLRRPTLRQEPEPLSRTL